MFSLKLWGLIQTPDVSGKYKTMIYDMILGNIRLDKNKGYFDTK